MNIYYHIRDMKTHIHIFGFPYYHISIFIYDICTPYTHFIYKNFNKKYDFTTTTAYR